MIWLSAIATDMSPSTLILPVMKAVVGLRSPLISDSRSSSDSLMVQSAGASVVEMVADGVLPDRGFVRQEDILLDDFFKTLNGQYFTQHND